MQTEYSSLQDIIRQKNHVRSMADQQKKEMHKLWTRLLTHKEQTPKTKMQKIFMYADKAAFAVDGIMFGWKIYNKFKGKRH